MDFSDYLNHHIDYYEFVIQMLRKCYVHFRTISTSDTALDRIRRIMVVQKIVTSEFHHSRDIVLALVLCPIFNFDCSKDKSISKNSFKMFYTFGPPSLFACTPQKMAQLHHRVD